MLATATSLQLFALNQAAIRANSTAEGAEKMAMDAVTSICSEAVGPEINTNCIKAICEQPVFGTVIALDTLHMELSDSAKVSTAESRIVAITSLEFY